MDFILQQYIIINALLMSERKKIHLDTYTVSAKGPRDYMEDRSVVEEIGKNSILMAVFDGHGGYEVAEMCSSESPRVMHQILKMQPDTGIAIRKLYSRLDELSKQFHNHVGATAAVVLIKDDHIIASNCGDTMTLAKTVGGDLIWMSEDHKVENEKKRVESLGGIVTYAGGCARINMGLNIARSIGDNYVKDIVVSTPYVASYNRHRVRLDWLVIASDGVWDVYTKEEFDRDFSAFLRLNYGNFEKSVEQIVHQAYAKGSMDNITVVFVRFRYVE